MANRSTARRIIRGAGAPLLGLVIASLLVGLGIAPSPAGAATGGLDPVQVAQAQLANCQLLAAHTASGTSQHSRALNCVSDQKAIIALYQSATPSPTGTTAPPTTPPATTPPATTPPATTPPATTPAATTPPATSPPPTTPPPGPCTTFAACGYPTAATSGVPVGTALTALVTSPTLGLVITTPGTVIDGRDIQGWLDIRAANVTVQNSRISSAYWWGIKANYAGTTGLRVLHNTIVSAPTPVSGTQNDYAVMVATANSFDEVGFNDVSGFRNGVDVSSGWVHENFVHDLRVYPGAHTQAIYGWCDPGALTIRHNTLLNQTAIAYASGDVYIAPDCGAQNGRTLDNNWLAGGSLTVYGGGSGATNVQVTSNRFSTEVWPDCGYYGTDGYYSQTNAGNVWFGNVWANGPRVGQTVTP